MPQKPPTKAKRSSFSSLCKRLIVAIIAILTISTFLLATTLQHSKRSTPTWTNCGHSPTTALSRGCHYDVMIGSWMLPSCFDSALMEEFLTARDWEFFYDVSLSKVMPMDVIRRGEHRHAVYATMHQHGHHCAYVWVKQFRAAMRGGMLDDLSANEHHTRHCADSMFVGDHGANASLALEVKYFSCVGRMGEGVMNRTIGVGEEGGKKTQHEHEHAHKKGWGY